VGQEGPTVIDGTESEEARVGGEGRSEKEGQMGKSTNQQKFFAESRAALVRNLLSRSLIAKRSSAAFRRSRTKRKGCARERSIGPYRDAGKTPEEIEDPESYR
jgi:hypothetical protein